MFCALLEGKQWGGGHCGSRRHRARPARPPATGRRRDRPEVTSFSPVSLLEGLEGSKARGPGWNWPRAAGRRHSRPRAEGTRRRCGLDRAGSPRARAPRRARPGWGVCRVIGRRASAGPGPARVPALRAAPPPRGGRPNPLAAILLPPGASFGP